MKHYKRIKVNTLPAYGAGIVLCGSRYFCWERANLRGYNLYKVRSIGGNISIDHTSKIVGDL